MKSIKNFLNKDIRLVNGHVTNAVKHYLTLSILLTFNALVISFYVFLLVSLCGLI